MNRSELVEALKEESSLNRKDAEMMVQHLFDTISQALREEDRVEIRGFGSFSVKQYASYEGRNPKSGEKIAVASKKLPFFRVGKALKSLVDNGHDGRLTQRESATFTR
jgi:integration host factor subunit beta